MYINRVGYLGYKLYRLGWQNALHRNPSPVDHCLFSIFLYYRRGFTDAIEWIEECCVEENSHQFLDENRYPDWLK